MNWKTFFQIVLLIVIVSTALWLVLYTTTPKFKPSIDKAGYNFNKITGEWIEDKTH